MAAGSLTLQKSNPQHSNPYQTVQDYLSNVDRFKIIESTLRGKRTLKYRLKTLEY